MNQKQFVRWGNIIDNLAGIVLSILAGALLYQESPGWQTAVILILLNPVVFVGFRFLWHYLIGMPIFFILALLLGVGDE